MRKRVVFPLTGSLVLLLVVVLGPLFPLPAKAATVITDPLPTPNAHPFGIVEGPDSQTLWFTEEMGNKIGSVPNSDVGTPAEYPIPTANAFPQFITIGSDNNLWFTETHAGQIGQFVISTKTFHEFAIPSLHGILFEPGGIASGPDGNLWFTLSGLDSHGGLIGAIGRMTTSGTVTIFLVGLLGLLSHPQQIAVGPDGNLWFTDAGLNKLGRITPTGTLTLFSVPTANAGLQGIVGGPAGFIIFTEFHANKIGLYVLSTGQLLDVADPTGMTHPFAVVALPVSATADTLAVSFQGEDGIGLLNTDQEVAEDGGVGGGVNNLNVVKSDTVSDIVRNRNHDLAFPDELSSTIDLARSVAASL
ncbi:MAG TPA: hypothetical protein VFV38_42680 [Ktedonobacteraceae bacterium]|nr:hypothetical protein [Ktedonobacteraceae bacterium]